MDSFQEIAPFYDRLMATVPYDMWLEYYRLLLAHQNIEPKTVLDVCCGTGTLTEKMAQVGFEMTGFDLSKPMIVEARRKAKIANLDIRYHVKDATQADLGTRFDAAYSFFDSLNYIRTLKGFDAAIHRIAEHVKPGGSFIFDLNTAYAFEANLFDQKDLRKKAKVRYNWLGTYNAETRVIHVNMVFWVGDKEFHEVHIQRAHSDEEVRASLSSAGFSEIRCFNSYTLDPPREHSDRVHYCCIKK